MSHDTIPMRTQITALHTEGQHEMTTPDGQDGHKSDTTIQFYQCPSTTFTVVA
jgi:hypothetical protein